MADKAVLRPISRTRAYALAADAIRNQIAANVWLPGSRLPSERELAEQLAISRASTREALRILEAQGFLEIKPGEGTFVTDPKSRQDDPQGDALVFADNAQLGDIWETRKIIEPQAAYLAAERCDSNDIQAIAASVQQMELLANAGRWEESLFGNVEFHLAIGQASGNHVLRYMQNVLARLMTDAMKAQDRADQTPERVRKVIREHQRILDAIKAAAPQAAHDAMFEHLVDSWMARWYVKNTGGGSGTEDR